MKIRDSIPVCAAVIAVLITAVPVYADNLTNKDPAVLGPGRYACTLAKPQYTVYSSASRIVMHKHQDKLDMNASYARWANAYLSAGYNPSGYSSESCNAYGWGRALPVPILVSRAGPMTSSIHLYTTSNFTGDGGYDLWLTRSRAAHTYVDMRSSTDNTEMMVWVEHPGLGIGDSYVGNPVAHHVYVDGRYWDILHAGRTSWHPWEYLVFATARLNPGNFTMRDVHLGALIRWGEAHGYIEHGDTIQAIDAGFEGHELTGGTSVRGYRLKVGNVTTRVAPRRRPAWRRGPAGHPGRHHGGAGRCGRVAHKPAAGHRTHTARPKRMRPRVPHRR